MTFDRIQWGSRWLAFDPPLSLDPLMDEDSCRLSVIYKETLSIHVFAQTREQLAHELAEQLFFQWDTHACELPERLTAPARRLQEVLRTRMREESLTTQP